MDARNVPDTGAQHARHQLGQERPRHQECPGRQGLPDRQTQGRRRRADEGPNLGGPSQSGRKMGEPAGKPRRRNAVHRGTAPGPRTRSTELHAGPGRAPGGRRHCDSSEAAVAGRKRHLGDHHHPQPGRRHHRPAAVLGLRPAGRNLHRRRVPVREASATVPGQPFTATFAQIPAKHDGSNPFDLHLHFSHEPAQGFSYRTVQEGLFDLTGGAIERVWRLHRGLSRSWGITIAPSGLQDVQVAVRTTTVCAGENATCDIAGRTLPAGAGVTIMGPPPPCRYQTQGWKKGRTQP